MRLAHIADTHIGHRQYGLNQREDDMVSTFLSALRDIAKEEADAVLLPGDLFHSRDLRPKNLDSVERVLTQTTEDIPVIVTRGNHDANLSPREVTWLNYLHERGHIILLEAELGDPDVAGYDRHRWDDPGNVSGFVDLDSQSLDDPIRVFGLQWRGARTDRALKKVARGIEAVNADHGTPAYTFLLGHFGIEDEVPALGGTVTHADLRPVRKLVDYLALGHIHKRYTSGEWIYNPGSPEAHNTREGRDDWNHGYFLIDIDEQPAGDLAHETTFQETKRRPYFTIEFDVTEYATPGDLEAAFRNRLATETEHLEDYCSNEKFTRNGDRRPPIIDLRFRGTLQFARSELRLEDLEEFVLDACDALYVQTNTGIRTADVQELIEELDEQDVFVDGRLNTTALEQQVFETIAAESEYDEHVEDVASVLQRTHSMAQAEEDVEDIADLVSDRRRELFPDLTNDVTVDVAEEPLEEVPESIESGPSDRGEAE